MTELEDLLRQEREKQAKAQQAVTVLPPEVFEEFKQAVEKDLEPYMSQVTEGIDRALNLLGVANKLLASEADGAKLERSAAASEDIMRSVVVLTHAYLEDFLRTVGRNFLPIATEATLNNIPLVGLNENSRPEKFFLGRLAQHRGKLVDDVIRESITEHLSRVSFNNATEIVSFLTTLGLMPADRTQLPAIDAMIHRRHQIVHHGDRVEGKVQAIGSEVFDWVGATRVFLGSLFPTIASRKYTAKFMREKFNIEIRES